MFHSIAQDFVKEMPEHKDKIIYLRHHSRNFSQLISEYDTIEREVKDIEEYVENTIYVETLKVRLTKLRDELQNFIFN